MGKHLSFWIGFFAAALLAVPVALGVMGVAEQRLRDLAVAVFAGVAALVVVLVIALFFRDRILRRLLGRSEVALEDVAGSLVGAVAAARDGDTERAEAHTRALVQGGVGWYTWSSFYRWVIGSALGLLLAFGAFVGTVLLFEQTRTLRVQTERIGEQTELMKAQTERLREQTEAAAMQNEIMVLSLVNQLREQLLASVQTQPLGEWLVSLGVPGVFDPLVTYVTDRENCTLYFDLAYPLSGPPSGAVVGAIAELAQSNALGERVVNALGLLARDSHGSVALGAVLALQAAGKPYDRNLVLEDLFLVDLVRMTSDISMLRLRRSYVVNLFCPNCLVHMTASIYAFNAPIRPSGGFNLAINPSKEDALNGVLVVSRDKLDATWLPRAPVPLQTGPFFPTSWNGWVTRHKDLPACDIMAEIARVNPLLTMMTPDPP